jgi:hypothetical protein
MSNKQCGNCKHATKTPPKDAACSVRDVQNAQPMKYTDANMPYCDAFNKKWELK